MRSSFWNTCTILILFAALTTWAPFARAQQVPPSADVGRVEKNLEQGKDLPPRPGKIMQMPSMQPSSQLPANAYAVRVTVNKITVHGVTAFKESHISALYDQFLGKEVSLNTIWQIAKDITDLYQRKGYFLSRAYVPQQAIEGGHIQINVVEGFIGRVELENNTYDRPLIRRALDEVVGVQPIRRQELEALLLQLNDLPGTKFDALLKPEDKTRASYAEGQVVLALQPQKLAPRAQASVDNYGSKYLGPVQFNTSIQAALIPFQETTFSYATSVPDNELKTASLSHKIPLRTNLKLRFDGAITATDPGSTLAVNNVLGDSTSLGVGVEYGLIRQRQKNLMLKAGLGLRNSKTDLLNAPLVRDKIRTLDLAATGDFFDGLGAFNQASLSASRGLGILGSSEKGDANLSRSLADPTYTKLNASYLRQQPLPKQFLFQFQVEGQWSPESLVSSEEFGFGGARLGRGFDASEISGDQGVAAGVELHYTGLPKFHKTKAMPFIFYDIGRVWNEEAGRQDQTASSAGGGVRFIHEATEKTRIYADLYAAQPLLKRQDTPQLGQGKAPRIGFRLGVLN